MELGKINNLNFVLLSFAKLKFFISYLTERGDIRVVKHNKSYTSKTSYIGGDYIPEYGVDYENAKFSEKRRPKHCKGMYKENGFLGLYVTKCGKIVNSDLNGGANIGRKVYSDLLANINFDEVIIIVHPDYKTIKARNCETKRKRKRRFGKP